MDPLDYQLIIKIPLKALDDVAARTEANLAVADLQAYVSKDTTDMKLQRVYADKPPHGVKW